MNVSRFAILQSKIVLFTRPWYVDPNSAATNLSTYLVFNYIQEIRAFQNKILIYTSKHFDHHFTTNMIVKINSTPVSLMLRLINRTAPSYFFSLSLLGSMCILFLKLFDKKLKRILILYYLSNS